MSPLSRGVLVTCLPSLPGAMTVSSGLLFDGDLVLTLGTLLEPLCKDASSLDMIAISKSPEELTLLHLADIKFTVIVEAEDMTQQRRVARLVAAWRCPLVSHGVHRLLSDWQLAPDSDKEDEVSALYKDLLSTFLVFQLDVGRRPSHEQVASGLERLLEETAEVHRGQEVVVESTLFGRRFFLNSWSQGVVSNRLGQQGCLMLTDARSGVGCEGGPIYTADREGRRLLLGVVLATVSWWKGEWVGFTIGVSLRPVLRRLGAAMPVWTPSNVLDDMLGDRCVVLVRCGSSWGSGVVVDAALGLIVTCSHVVKNRGVDVSVVWGGVARKATLVYRTPDGVAYDVAVVRVSTPASDWRSVALNHETPVKGDRVYIVGWALFSERSPSLAPSITRGVVSHVTEGVMLQTTCCVQSGASGGAVLDAGGALLGLVACNARDTATGALYPHVNMAVPTAAFADIIQEFVRTSDVHVLNQLEIDDVHVQKIWKMNFTISKL